MLGQVLLGGGIHRGFKIQVLEWKDPHWGRGNKRAKKEGCLFGGKSTGPRGEKKKEVSKFFY